MFESIHKTKSNPSTTELFFMCLRKLLKALCSPTSSAEPVQHTQSHQRSTHLNLSLPPSCRNLRWGSIVRTCFHLEPVSGNPMEGLSLGKGHTYDPFCLEFSATKTPMCPLELACFLSCGMRTQQRCPLQVSVMMEMFSPCAIQYGSCGHMWLSGT